jgi:undecaprenyl phosphate-alpha-L-ara4N flippase subunit ArnF
MFYALLSVLLNAAAQLTLKNFSSNLNRGIPLRKFVTDLNFLSTGFLYLASILFWVLALRKLPLSTTFPLQALGYVIVSVLSVIIFRENVSNTSWIGLSIIVLGVFVLRYGV